jgi:heavy metal translocating P-type ATPase
MSFRAAFESLTAPAPIYFDEFFESGLEESVSPFLTPRSRPWGKNLPLKASLLSAALLALAFGLSFTSYALLSPLLLLFVYFIAGIPSLIDAIHDMLSLEVNIDMLMTLGAFLSMLIGSGMEGGLLLVLFSISGSLEEAVTGKARRSLRSLHRLAPTRICVIGDDKKIHEKHIQDVTTGTFILIRAGEIIPLDGVVTEGTSSINLVHLTGESIPVTKKVGDEVPAGALNIEGTLTVRVTHTSSDSTLARIIQLITQAQEARPKFQRWLDKVSRGYALSIIGLSLVFALSFPWILSMPYLGFEGSIYRSLAFLIAASPCALIIALPIAYLSAISSCARKGILLKGGITLDAIASCSAIAFDKTGTLTTGHLRCLGHEPLIPGAHYDAQHSLSIAAALERNAVHPIAKAILHEAKEKNISLATLKDFRSIPGYGLEAHASVNGQWTYVYIGHPDHIQSASSLILKDRIQALREQGELVSVLLIGDQLTLFRFQDTIRPDIADVLSNLRTKHQLRLLILTGDHHNNARAIADKVGIQEYHADLRPEDKLEHVTKLSNQFGLAMIGDGINDAPALARATTGISMGQVGSRTAIDASDVVLLQDRLDLLSWLWSKAHNTRIVVRQNVLLSFGAIIFASLAAITGLIPLWLAVVLHEGGTVVVGLNSLRLLR